MVVQEYGSEVKQILVERNYDRLIKLAENLGNALGMARASQLSSIYRLLESAVTRLLESNDPNNQILLHQAIPKIVYMIARSGPRERSSLEKLQYAIVDSIACISDVEGTEKKLRARTFRDFLEAVLSFHQYALTSGAKFDLHYEERKLRDKINNMQIEMNKLLQFVTASTGNAKVFLSHSHSDKIFVEKLKKDLEDNNITTWYDNKDLDIGEIVSEAISQGIEQSWFFLIVVSPDSVSSNWVKYELNEAYDGHISDGKKILPVVIGDIEDKDIPKRLKKHLYADFRSEEGYEDSFERLLRAIVREGAKQGHNKSL